jgi:hypothetical protein
LNKRQKEQIDSSSEGLLVLRKVETEKRFAELKRGCGRAETKLKQVEALVRAQGLPHLRLRRKRTDAETISNDRARRAIRTEHLIPIAVRARPLFKHQPDVMGALVLPHARANIRTHAEAALAMAEALSPFKAFCIKEKFPPRFLEGLRSAGNRLLETATRSTSSRAKRQYSTEQLPVAIRELRRLTDIVDTEVKRLILREGRDNLPPAIAYTWGIAYKVGKPKGRPRKRSPKKDNKRDDTPPDLVA